MIRALGQRSGNESHPHFGEQHLEKVVAEACKPQPHGQLYAAIAHGSHYHEATDSYRQYSTLFLAPQSRTELTLSIGSITFYHETIVEDDIYWCFIDWSKVSGDIVITVYGYTYVIPQNRILQSTDMSCILFHPRVDKTQGEALCA